MGNSPGNIVLALGKLVAKVDRVIDLLEKIERNTRSVSNQKVVEENEASKAKTKPSFVNSRMKRG